MREPLDGELSPPGFFNTNLSPQADLFRIQLELLDFLCYSLIHTCMSSCFKASCLLGRHVLKWRKNYSILLTAHGLHDSEPSMFQNRHDTCYHGLPVHVKHFNLTIFPSERPRILENQRVLRVLLTNLFFSCLYLSLVSYYPNSPLK